MKSASNSSSSSGCAAIRTRIRPKTPLKKSIIAASPTPTSTIASGIPGWKTDRGRIYIMWGPPDEIDSHPSGGSYERPADEGGGETSTFPFEDWRYRYLEGIGNNVEIEFVDPTMTGEYHLTMDPSEKDALLYVPGAGLTMMESMGMSSKTARFNNTDGTHMAQPLGGQPREQVRILASRSLRENPASPARQVQGSRSRSHLAPGAQSGGLRLPLGLPAHHQRHDPRPHLHSNSRISSSASRRKKASSPPP